MADIYIGDYGKAGEYFTLQTNCEDHKSTLNFDGSRFLLTDDALLVGLHVTSIEGLNKKSTIVFPNFALLSIHLKPYEYETYSDGKKVKATIEPTAREKLLTWFLTDEKFPLLNWEKNQGKGGFIQLGASANDVPVLNGEGNAVKHARFVIEFDDDIKPFDMSDEKYAISATSGSKGKGGYQSKPAETEAQKITSRQAAVDALLLSMGIDSKQAAENQEFVVLASLMLGLPVPSGLQYTF